MATEFDNSAHYAVFTTSANLNSTTGKYARWSEVVVSALRAAGALDKVEDSTTAPTDKTKLWLDKNSDPAPLKRWSQADLAWISVTYEYLFQNFSIAIKQPVKAATTANITLSGEQTIDGVAVVSGDRVLVKDQTTGAQNGIYVAATGAWARASDADATGDFDNGTQVFVQSGTVSANKTYRCATASPIIGTDAISFSVPGPVTGAEISFTDDFTVLATHAGDTLVSNKASAIAATLGAASTYGADFQFRAFNLGAGAVTYTPNGAETINGAASLVLQQYESAVIWTDGSTWRADFSEDVLVATTIANATAIPDVSLSADLPLLVTDFDRGGLFQILSGSLASNGLSADGVENFQSDGGSFSLRRLYSGLVNVKWSGAKGDCVTSRTGVSTATDATFTDANASWSSDDVGKVIHIKGAGTAGAIHKTTIASINSATSIELTDVAVTSVATANYFYGTDDHDAIETAINFCIAQGRQLFFPTGNYLIDTDGGTINIKGLSVVGERVVDATTLDKAANTTGATPNIGANLFIIGTSNSPFTIYQGGIAFRGIGYFYPDQVVSASPTVYPVTYNCAYPDPTNIKNSIEYVEFSECILYNTYKFFNHSNSSYEVGNFIFKNNRICNYNTCIYIITHADILEIHHNHISPGVYDEIEASTDARGYILNNGTFVHLGEGEGLFFHDNFMFQIFRGIRFSGAGSTAWSNLSHITNNTFDQVPLSVLVDSGCALINSRITNNTFLSKDQIEYAAATYDANHCSITIQSTTAHGNTLVIADNVFSDTTGRHIYDSGTAPNELIIESNLCRNYGQGQTSAAVFPSIHINNANCDAVITGNRIKGLAIGGSETRRGVFLQSVSRAVVNNNRIDTSTNAIQVNSSTDLICTGNITTNSSSTALNITAPSGTLIGGTGTENIAA